MSWLCRLRAAGRLRMPGREDSPQGEPLEKNIDEELLFHMRALVDDNLARGMSSDDAWSQAHQRFGSLSRYASECRSEALSRVWRWQKVSLVAVALLVPLVGWLVFAVESLRSGQIDLRGEVVDHEDRPISGAKLAVILKTWPDGGYRQESFATTSDALGKFFVPRLVPRQGQFAVQVAAVKDGYALTSAYHLQEELHRTRGPRADLPMRLRCEDASRLTLVVRDAEGRPIPGARVAPASRKTRDGWNHAVYFQASKPVQLTSDAAGQVFLNCFEPGDEAEIFLQLLSGDWESRAFDVPAEGAVVIVAPQCGKEDGQLVPARSVGG